VRRREVEKRFVHFLGTVGGNHLKAAACMLQALVGLAQRVLDQRQQVLRAFVILPCAAGLHPELAGGLGCRQHHRVFLRRAVLFLKQVAGQVVAGHRNGAVAAQLFRARTRQRHGGLIKFRGLVQAHRIGQFTGNQHTRAHHRRKRLGVKLHGLAFAGQRGGFVAAHELRDGKAAKHGRQRGLGLEALNHAFSQPQRARPVLHVVADGVIRQAKQHHGPLRRVGQCVLFFKVRGQRGAFLIMARPALVDQVVEVHARILQKGTAKRQ
jgi:hypothetical protein